MKTLFLALALSVAALCQTPAANVSLPAYVLAGASYNQFTGWSGIVSGIVPETAKGGGFYGSVTADVVAVKLIDPVTKKPGYVLSPNFRAGEHKVILNSGKNMLLVGGDMGASFSQAGLTSGVSLGLAGSFTVTYIRQITAHVSLGLPVRMLYMAGVGPSGTGVWNPVVEPSFIWKP